MKSLYMLTESDFDSLIYEAIAERLTGESYYPISRRMRKGSGLAAVHGNMALALQEVSRMAAESGVCFIIAMDNDRAPHATCPEALSGSDRRKLALFDQRKHDRYIALLDVLDATLGHDRSRWKVPVAVAVPVEMIETWLILIASNSKVSDLPRFSRHNDAPAVHFYGSTKPPPQLKDLSDAAQRDDGYPNQDEWVLHLVSNRMDPSDLATRSCSFKLFSDWLTAWPSK